MSERATIELTPEQYEVLRLTAQDLDAEADRMPSHMANTFWARAKVIREIIAWSIRPAALNAAAQRDERDELLRDMAGYILGAVNDWEEKAALLARFNALNEKEATNDVHD